MAVQLRPHQLVRYPDDPHKLHCYEVSVTNFGSSGDAFLIPVKQDGTPRTLGMVARYCKWVHLRDLTDWAGKPLASGS